MGTPSFVVSVYEDMNVRGEDKEEMAFGSRELYSQRSLLLGISFVSSLSAIGKSHEASISWSRDLDCGLDRIGEAASPPLNILISSARLCSWLVGGIVSAYSNVLQEALKETRERGGIVGLGHDGQQHAHTGACSVREWRWCRGEAMASSGRFRPLN